VQTNGVKENFNAVIAAARKILAHDPDNVPVWTAMSGSCRRKGMVPTPEEAAAKARILGW
jgi:hypothetical protein